MKGLKTSAKDGSLLRFAWYLSQYWTVNGPGRHLRVGKMQVHRVAAAADVCFRMRILYFPSTSQSLINRWVIRTIPTVALVHRTEQQQLRERGGCPMRGHILANGSRT